MLGVVSHDLDGTKMIYSVVEVPGCTEEKLREISLRFRLQVTRESREDCVGVEWILRQRILRGRLSYAFSSL